MDLVRACSGSRDSRTPCPRPNTIARVPAARTHGADSAGCIPSRQAPEPAAPPPLVSPARGLTVRTRQDFPSGAAEPAALRRPYHSGPGHHNMTWLPAGRGFQISTSISGTPLTSCGRNCAALQTGRPTKLRVMSSLHDFLRYLLTLVFFLRNCAALQTVLFARQDLNFFPTRPPWDLLLSPCPTDHARPLPDLSP